MLQAGIKGKKEITVTIDKTAKAMGSGTMRLSLRREVVLSVLRLILSMFRLHRLA